MSTKNVVVAAICTAGAAGAWIALNPTTAAAPGTLDPPAGNITGTGVTTQQLSDQIAVLQATIGSQSGMPSSRQIERVFLNDAQSTIIGSSGLAVLHSVTCSRGRISIRDARVEVGEIARLIANPVELNGEILYEGTNQVIFDVVVQLPLTIADQINDGSSSETVVIYTPLP